MKKNIGTIDRGLRILLAVVIVALYFTNVIGGTLAIVSLVLAAVFILTGFAGICPLYMPFGISTCAKKD